MAYTLVPPRVAISERSDFIFMSIITPVHFTLGFVSIVLPYSIHAGSVTCSQRQETRDGIIIDRASAVRRQDLLKVNK